MEIKWRYHGTIWEYIEMLFWVVFRENHRINGLFLGKIFTGYHVFNTKYWLVVDLPPEKYEFVSWDDDITNIWKVIKFHGSSHHQPAILSVFFGVVSTAHQESTRRSSLQLLPTLHAVGLKQRPHPHGCY